MKYIELMEILWTLWYIIRIYLQLNKRAKMSGFNWPNYRRLGEAAFRQCIAMKTTMESRSWLVGIMCLKIRNSFPDYKSLDSNNLCSVIGKFLLTRAATPWNIVNLSLQFIVTIWRFDHSFRSKKMHTVLRNMLLPI